MYDNYVYLMSGKHTRIWFSGVNSIGKVCALLYVALYFLPIISYWGYADKNGNGVVILCEQDSSVCGTLGFPIGVKFWLNWKKISTGNLFLIIGYSGMTLQHCRSNGWAGLM